MDTVVLFYDENFPYAGERPEKTYVEKMNKLFTLVAADELADTLKDPKITSFINLHGPYFPKQAWPTILQYLKKGKGIVHFGGIPFRIPCNLIDGQWQEEREQTAYHMQMNIHEALPVKTEQVELLQANHDIQLLNGFEELFTIEDTYNFILHVSKVSTIKGEMGSNGPMDARIYPLLKGFSPENREIAAPIVLMENYRGNFTGGRWVFINQQLKASFWQDKGIDFIEGAAGFVSSGVTEMWLKTNYATYEIGEQPVISLQYQSINSYEREWTYEITISKEGEVKYHHLFTATVDQYLNITKLYPDIVVEPGLFEIDCICTSDNQERIVMRQGFWGVDHALLAQGEALTCDRDYFRKGDKPFPIVGMTYMTSDVSRYFLYLPNPAVWDRDFAQMKKAGINYVRTGAWFAYRNMMFVDGHVNEEVLRALDAFILAAKKHDIYVTLCFFSFTPETWDGENPYLDPRSVEAQKRFIGTIIQRHQQTKNVNWDLINEPSMFDPANVFAGPRTNHDRFEKQAYQTWLQAKYESITKLQENWNMTAAELPSFSSINPPAPSEINSHIQNMASGKKGLKWLDYTLFTMEMHNQWAKELAATVKHYTPNQLVTVGQDEALAGQRPSAFFYEEVVDYTTNHSWWMMDQLLWDSIFTKTPNKPNLIQETGIMYVEQPNNIAKRSEEELRNILERKYAYAYSGAGAGAVQWIWNTNYFMDNVNESNIGTLRADGTEKPETNVSYDFGTFMKEVGHIFEKRELEDIAVIFPYSNDFSNRRMAFSATTKLTRVMAYELNIPFRALSEYHLEALRQDTPKLIIVPSAHNFQTAAFNELLNIVEEKGSVLLFTGPLNINEFWEKTNRAAHLVGETVTGNIRREEMMMLQNRAHSLSFPDLRIAEVMKEVPTASEKPNTVKEYAVGKGKLIWSPAPIELNERTEPLIALYNYAIDQAHISSHLEWVQGDYPGVYGRKLSLADADLFVFVSEFGDDTTVEITNPTNQASYEFILEAERSVLFATDKVGNIIGIYRKNEISIKTK
ncbi:beta-galactosidase [Lederbergia lenta]|uniref:Glycoside hydrolase family protein n=1 Tax=Lederbergia lenta TaxID=1467 RepID=A0A2X4W830_LEDLE|nr:beta-galactosidase [Lederbergia lenta]MEC2325755.1 beta-galactosidase [Lederbergia lenta]SQI53800.1 glycoside hydrolase family protein [Lederbergia lenta]